VGAQIKNFIAQPKFLSSKTQAQINCASKK